MLLSASTILRHLQTLLQEHEVVQTDEEGEAGFEARCANALLEFIKTKLCDKHALGRATTPGALLLDEDRKRPAERFAGGRRDYDLAAHGAACCVPLRRRSSRA
jgi:hypothetical protein